MMLMMNLHGASLVHEALRTIGVSTRNKLYGLTNKRPSKSALWKLISVFWFELMTKFVYAEDQTAQENWCHKQNPNSVHCFSHYDTTCYLWLKYA
jgi:hypothetical protein